MKRELEFNESPRNEALAEQDSSTQPAETPKREGEPIVFSMAVQGVDYAGLVALPELRAGFEGCMRQAIIGDSNLPEENVVPELSSGSVLVKALVYPPPGGAAKLLADLRASEQEVGRRAAEGVRNLPGIGAVATGPISVDVLGIQGPASLEAAAKEEMSAAPEAPPPPPLPQAEKAAEEAEAAKASAPPEEASLPPPPPLAEKAAEIAEEAKASAPTEEQQGEAPPPVKEEAQQPTEEEAVAEEALVAQVSFEPSAPRPAEMSPFGAYYQDAFKTSGGGALLASFPRAACSMRSSEVPFVAQDSRPADMSSFGAFYQERVLPGVQAELQDVLYSKFPRAKRAVFRPRQAALNEFPEYYVENFRTSGPPCQSFPRSRPVTFPMTLEFPMSDAQYIRAPSIGSWKCPKPLMFPPGQISLSMVVQGVCHSRLMLEPELKVSFEAAIKNAIAVGREFCEEDVALSLSRGSVMVKAVICCPRQSFMKTMSDLVSSKTSIAELAAHKVAKLAGIDDITDGDIGVCVTSVQAATPEPPPAEEEEEHPTDWVYRPSVGSWLNRVPIEVERPWYYEKMDGQLGQMQQVVQEKDKTIDNLMAQLKAMQAVLGLALDTISPETAGEGDMGQPLSPMVSARLDPAISARLEPILSARTRSPSRGGPRLSARNAPVQSPMGPRAGIASSSHEVQVSQFAVPAAPREKAVSEADGTVISQACGGSSAVGAESEVEMRGAESVVTSEAPVAYEAEARHTVQKLTSHARAATKAALEEEQVNRTLGETIEEHGEAECAGGTEVQTEEATEEGVTLGEE